MPNLLADQTSPYLLQHADNPVDWQPWGPDALEQARALDRPILLSVGYAACHWCHVMERESFTDEGVAAVMNDHFVCIKVDREERPDVDAVYMAAVQAMTGHGGWPMTVFLTPDGHPFFGGTYYPPEPRHGMPSFRQVLDAIHEAWTTQRDGVVEQGGKLADHIRQIGEAGAADDIPGEDAITEAARTMLGSVDDEWGGFGGAPKFPQPMTIEFLLRAHRRGIEGALAAATRSLDAMARGGIFDQLGGGFHRYSVDRIWLVPHFEKMLYDNGQLLRLYARAWQITDSPLYRSTAIATAEYLVREMQHPEGGFYASQDADTEGVEGRFYVWPYDEFIAATGDDMPVAVAAFAVAGTGNWEGVNVLSRPDDVDAISTTTGLSSQEVEDGLARASAALRAKRDERIRPATDDKVLAAWNAMAIMGLAEAGRVFDRPDLVESAVRAGSFVVDVMRVDGRLQRSWRDGRTSGPAFLDDHALMADACLTLFETTNDRRWWEEAVVLIDQMRTLFADPAGGFFDTGSDAEAPLLRPRDQFDNAVPSGNSAAAEVLLRMAAYTGDATLEVDAVATLRRVATLMIRAPLGFGTALGALDRFHAPRREVAIIGDPVSDAVAMLHRAALQGYAPDRVVAVGPPGSTTPALLAGRTELDGRAAAYVCSGFACQAPTADPVELGRQLLGS